jgi:MinD-like ATPase involved in chromosome partitioning or flagellar assembly
VNAQARIVLGLAPRDEEAIEQELYGNAGLRVLGSGADAGELLRLAAAGSPDLVLLSAGLPGLDAAALASLRSLGPRLAGLALDERAAAALETLGLELVVRPPAQAGALLSLLALERRTPGLEPETPKPPRPRGAPGRSGSVVAVLGSKGAPGASELAASFAALLARRHRVLLAEFDADGGGLAERLGVDPHAGSLLGLMRALAAGERDAGALLPHWTVAVGRGWPAVLPGLPRATAEPASSMPAGLALALLDLLAADFPLVVCDLGHRLGRSGSEGDLAARLHREAALAADALVVVVGARPAQRLAGLAQLDLLLGELAAAPEALRIVVNGQPGLRSARAADEAGAFSAELASRGLTVDAWLPFDERALRSALRRGLPLAAASRRGPYARALAELASLILLPSLPRPAARKRRLRALPSGAPVRSSAASEEVALPWRR